MSSKSLMGKLQSWVSKQLLPEAYIESSAALKGRVVVVTGAARGIGKASAQLLAEKGAIVIAMVRDAKPLEGVSMTVEADITDGKKVDKAIGKVLKEYGRIDAVVNCAGIFLDKALDETSADEFRSVVDVNLVGSFNIARAVVPSMKKSRKGLIINVGSKISHNTNVAPHKVTYAASKYAVEGFSFALNKELKNHGVRVCCLMPGTVATFASRKSKEFLNPYEVASMIEFIIRSENIDFESVVMKSRNQNI